MNRKLGFKRFGIAAFVSKWLSSDHWRGFNETAFG
jgi:hypothetical protein